MPNERSPLTQKIDAILRPKLGVSPAQSAAELLKSRLFDLHGNALLVEAGRAVRMFPGEGPEVARYAVEHTAARQAATDPNAESGYALLRKGLEKAQSWTFDEEIPNSRRKGWSEISRGLKIVADPSIVDRPKAASAESPAASKQFRQLTAGERLVREQHRQMLAMGAERTLRSVDLADVIPSRRVSLQSPQLSMLLLGIKNELRADTPRVDLVQQAVRRLAPTATLPGTTTTAQVMAWSTFVGVATTSANRLAYAASLSAAEVHQAQATIADSVDAAMNKLVDVSSIALPTAAEVRSVRLRATTDLTELTDIRTFSREAGYFGPSYPLLSEVLQGVTHELKHPQTDTPVVLHQLVGRMRQPKDLGSDVTVEGRNAWATLRGQLTSSANAMTWASDLPSLAKALNGANRAVTTYRAAADLPVTTPGLHTGR